MKSQHSSHWFLRKAVQEKIRISVSTWRAPQTKIFSIFKSYIMHKNPLMRSRKYVIWYTYTCITLEWIWFWHEPPSIHAISWAPSPPPLHFRLHPFQSSVLNSSLHMPSSVCLTRGYFSTCHQQYWARDEVHIACTLLL